MDILLTDFKYGTIIALKNDYFITNALLHTGQYCDEEVQLLCQILNEEDTVIEVGSNIGSLTIPIARAVREKGKVYAIEPQKRVCDILRANMNINSLIQVDVKNIAIGDREKIVKLPILDYESRSNFGGVEINENNKGENVAQSTLDIIFKEITSLKLLKIDAEGMEPEILAGGIELIKSHKPFVYCENDRPKNSQKIISTLVDLKYSVYSHISHVFNPDNIKGMTRNIFEKDYICENVLAVPNNLNFPHLKRLA